MKTICHFNIMFSDVSESLKNLEGDAELLKFEVKMEHSEAFWRTIMGTHVVRASYHKKLFIIIILKINRMFYFVSAHDFLSCTICSVPCCYFVLWQKYITGSASNIEKSTLNKRFIFNRRRRWHFSRKMNVDSTGGNWLTTGTDCIFFSSSSTT